MTKSLKMFVTASITRRRIKFNFSHGFLQHKRFKTWLFEGGAGGVGGDILGNAFSGTFIAVAHKTSCKKN